MKNILAPSLLAADFLKVGEQIKAVEEGGAGYLHYDVMDGIFVPSLSLGVDQLRCVSGGTSLTMDVHLMITDPIRYVGAFADAGADIITFHVEAARDVQGAIYEVKNRGLKVGLAISPDTSVSALYPYLEKADMFLIMSVYPGFGGQKFLPGALDRVRTLRGELKRRGLHADIEVDGGIYLSNVRDVLDAGANVIVSGSGIFKGDARENTRRMTRAMLG